MKCFVKKMIKQILLLIPYQLLVNCYDLLSKTIIVDILNEVYALRFFDESKFVSDIDSLIERANKKKRLCIIDEGTWKYKNFNFCFMKNMLSLIIYSFRKRISSGNNGRRLCK